MFCNFKFQIFDSQQMISEYAAAAILNRKKEKIREQTKAPIKQAEKSKRKN